MKNSINSEFYVKAIARVIDYTQYVTKVYEKSIIKSIRLNIGIEI